MEEKTLKEPTHNIQGKTEIIGYSVNITKEDWDRARRRGTARPWSIIVVRGMVPGDRKWILHPDIPCDGGKACALAKNVYKIKNGKWHFIHLKAGEALVWREK